ncbi:MAG: reverse transcriptase family protein, partial [Bacteroidales bacterium]
YCFYHEREGHLTSECWELKKLKESRGKNIPISTRKIIESENSDESINGKSDYIVFGINSNPFKFKTTYNKRTIKVLLDTGSDVNVINKTLIEVNEKIYTSDAKLKVANGERLQVIGKVNGIEVEIMGKSCVIDALVVDINENLLILGVPFTDKYVAGLKIQNKRLEIEWKLKEIKNQKETFNINQSVCTDFKNIFADDNTSLTGCDLIEHTITMNDPTPIAKSMYRLGYNLENAVEQEVMKLLRDKIIRPSKSPWRAPVVPILKKNGQIRLCIDYRGLNENTKKDKYPMPLIDEIIDGLQGAKVFSILDAFSGYHQIKMAEKDIEKTAFGCKFGIYEFLRMPFGLANGPATFHRLIDHILREEKWKFVVAYLDDIIVFSKTMEEHELHLKVILTRLKKAGLKLNKKKCEFFKTELKILGHVVNEGGVKMDPERIKAIQNCELPKTIKQMQSFIGFVSYCQKYIPNLAGISSPLYEGLKNLPYKSGPIATNNEMQKSFERIKIEIEKNV